MFNFKVDYINERLTGPWSSSLFKAINNADADVIIASSASFMYMNYPLLRKKIKYPKPFIFQGALHFRGDQFPDFFTPSILKSIRQSDVYWSNTFFETKMLKEKDVDEKKIITTGIGIRPEDFANADPEFFRKLYNISSDEILIVCISRFDAFKGLDVLMNASFLLNKNFQNFRIIFAGIDFGYLNELKKICNSFEPQIASKILFLEKITDVEKYNLCAAMDILVLPSVNESFGIVFLESWACKKPVIGADIGAVASVISNENDGFLFSPKNSEDLALKIETLCRNKNLRESFGQKGYEKVKQNYTWEKVANICRESCFLAIKNFRKESTAMINRNDN